MNRIASTQSTDANWKGLSKIGGTAALIIVLVALVELGVTFLPGGGGVGSTMSVTDWFAFLQDNWFFGLRNLGLLNIVMTTLGIPMFFALYGAHRRTNGAYAALAMIIDFIAIAVFLATNRAFSMLALSQQYAAAATDTQRLVLEAAGQAMLSVGQSHVPGTFMGFFLSEVAGILISLVMLQSGIFSKVSAYTGILGFAFLLIFEVFASFVPTLSGLAMIFAVCGGLLSMAWYILIARRLFQLGQGASSESVSP